MAESKEAGNTEQSAPQPADESRRGALKVLVTAGSIAYAGALAAVGASFATSTVGGETRERWLRAARLADLPEGEPRRVPMIGDARDAFTVTPAEQLGSVWLLRKGNDVKALSATCPHLGCAIDLAADKKGYSCPCHTSAFSIEGATQSGPSPRGMDLLATRITDGWVEVDFRKYRQGTAEKKESAS
ncbi:MAG: Rieske (2Fe-2S) protein [Polyangiaceae bacterium]|nr:Rieske (2Fe-2S) protein [Polyangiaceae bacterium]